MRQGLRPRSSDTHVFQGAAAANAAAAAAAAPTAAALFGPGVRDVRARLGAGNQVQGLRRRPLGPWLRRAVLLPAWNQLVWP